MQFPTIQAFLSRLGAASPPHAVSGNILQSLSDQFKALSFQAVITAFDGKGRPVLETPRGFLTTETPLALPKGTALTLELFSPSSSPSPAALKVVIKEINGTAPQLPPTAATPEALSSPTPETPSTASRHLITLVPLEEPSSPALLASSAKSPQAAFIKTFPGTIISGVITSTLTEESATVTAPPLAPNLPVSPLPPGTEIRVKILSVTPPPLPTGAPPTASAAPLPSPLAPFSAALQAYHEATSATPSSPPSPTPSSSAAPLSAPLSVPSPAATIPSALGAFVAPDAAVSLQGISPFSATVIAHTAHGESLLHSSLGTFQLWIESPLPPQTSVSLELLAIKPPSLPAEKSLPLDILAMLQRGTLGLEDFLTATPPSPAASNLTWLKETLPQANKQFADKLLWFWAGIQSGDAATWLGPASKELSLRDPATLEKLERKFLTLRQLLNHKTDQGWNSTLFPVYHEGRFHYGAWHFKKDEEPLPEKGKGKHFLLELNLSVWGAVELEGSLYPLSSPSSKHRLARFDLAVRSLKELSPGAKHDIASLYRDLASVYGYAGVLSFQLVESFAPSPLENIIAHPTLPGDILA